MVAPNDLFNYVLFTNPISRCTITGISELAKATGIKPKPTARSVATQVGKELALPLSKQMGGSYNLIRVAALSGAAAVCLAAYGRHSMKDTPETREYRQIYDSANQMHLIHSVALLAAPLARRPVITGALFTTGILLFSGTCYYKAIKKSKGEPVEHIPARLAPYGGVCLILGWLSLLF